MSQVIPDAESEPTVDVRLAGRALGIKPTRSYTLAVTGQLADGVPVIKVGGRYRVPTAPLRRALGLDSAAAASVHRAGPLESHPSPRPVRDPGLDDPAA